MAAKKRYVQVGVGGRAWSYTKAMVETWKKTCELTAICDINRGRMELCNSRIRKDLQAEPVAMYDARNFKKMIEEQRPDCVVVTSIDSSHDEYIVKAMDMGCDVICEKPMTIDEKKCQRIVDAINRTGRDLRVTFNCRYMPHFVQVKDLLMRDTIGEIYSMDLNWILNLDHGADYFRRWHGEIAKSGGLLLHKATHHFDLANWFLDDYPVEVHAMGDRRFYGADSGTVERLGLEGHGERCQGCPVAKKCPFYVDMRKDHRKALYLDQEEYDGYIRDRCVFHPAIDIMDTMGLVVRYSRGAVLSYSLSAYTPYEGSRFAFNGNKGRVEFEAIGAVYHKSSKGYSYDDIPEGMSLRVYPQFKAPRAITPTIGTGGHSGGDDRLMTDLYSGKKPSDRYDQAADYVSGAMSLLIGAAANKSMRTGKPVKIASLVKGLPEAKAKP